jgi:PAS domain-containing protein
MVNDSQDARPIYTIDAANRIVFVNPAWREFTGAEMVHAIGRPIWERVPGGVVRRIWEVLYSRVRAVGGSVFVPMRVDRADERRLIDIELSPQGDGSIRHICEPVWRERRAAVALLDPAYPRDQRVLRNCMWCLRIQVRLGVWEEIEQAQQSLAILAEATLPQLEPVACTSCKQSLLKAFPARVA